MKRPAALLCVAVMLAPLAACDDDYNRPGPGYYGSAPPPPPPPGPPPGYDRGGYDRGGYDYRNDPPPGYDPYRDYRDEQGQDRVLSRDDRVYRGSDGRYYCRRSDGSTGTVVGAVAGGALGAILGGGGLLGTVLGAGGGALLGRSVDKGEVHCR
ncbi:MAG: hypothetical protein JOY99_00340 [Sphingomonadaceae bacterium]|nr:hypothetical protein [Sphingomonadaceae bacterium]